MKQIINNSEFENLDCEELFDLISEQFHSEMKESLAIVNMQLETVLKSGKKEIGGAVTTIQSIREKFLEYIDMENHLLFPLLPINDKKHIDVKEEKNLAEFISDLKERHQGMKKQFQQIRYTTNGYKCDIDSSPSHKLAFTQLKDLEQDFNHLFFVEEEYLFPRFFSSQSSKINCK